MTSDVLRLGELPAPLLRTLLEMGGPAPAELLLGPAVGEDACAIDIRGGALVVATDPITLTGRGIGAHAVVINANDVAVMGVRPRWFLAAVLLPLGTTAAEVEALFADTHAALDRLGITLVGGHTEITAAVVQPIVGFRLDPDAALWFEPGRAICMAMSVDPWGVLASGTLLAAFPESIARRAETLLSAEGYAIARLGRAESGAGVYDQNGTALPRYEQDEVSRVLTEDGHD